MKEKKGVANEIQVSVVGSVRNQLGKFVRSVCQRKTVYLGMKTFTQWMEEKPKVIKKYKRKLTVTILQTEISA